MSFLERMVVDSYNIPLLISWIQIIIFFLLFLLFCITGIFSSDLTDNNSSSADSVPSNFDSSSLSRRFHSVDPTPISHHHGLGISINSSLLQSNQSIKEEEIRPVNAASRVTRTEEEEEESLSEKDTSCYSHHPCNFFERAGSVFLKCFGFDRSNKETENDFVKQEPKKQR